MLKLLVQWIIRVFRAIVNTVTGKGFHVRTRDVLFGRDLETDEMGWELDEDSVPLFSVGEMQLKRLFREPDKKIYPIQLGVTNELFELIGGRYIPRRLRNILNKVDAFQAVSSFLLYLNFNFGSLLRSEEQREKLFSYLGILMEADEICQKINLSDLPVYQSLAQGGVEKGEIMIDRLHLARRIRSGLYELSIVFPAFQIEFVEPANKKIAFWEKLDEETLIELHQILCDWQKLQELYDEISLDLSRIIKSIKESNPRDMEIRQAFYRIVGYVDAVRKSVEDGSEEVSEGIDKLQSFYQDLMILFENIRENLSDEDKSHETDYRSETSNGKTEECFAILGLTGEGNITLDRLKICYRKMIFKYHPDRNSAPDAQEKTKSIIKAYMHLNDELGRGVDLYA